MTKTRLELCPYCGHTVKTYKVGGGIYIGTCWVCNSCLGYYKPAEIKQDLHGRKIERTIIDEPCGEKVVD